jgi:galactonate dehydratase
VREEVGPDVDILIDVWRRPEPAVIVKFSEMIRDLNIFWFEEPVPSDNLNILAEVRRSIRIPVVTGECLYTKNDFREVFEKRAADIINPDVASCGGILQLKEIAAMAEPYYISVSPHNFNSTAIALAATLHVAAVMPNFLIAEYFVNFEEISTIVEKKPFKVENSQIRLPAKKRGWESKLTRKFWRNIPIGNSRSEYGNRRSRPPARIRSRNRGGRPPKNPARR